MDVEHGRVESVDFHATDAVRWHRLEIELGGNDHRFELLEAVGRELQNCHQQSDGRLAAVRLTVGGHTPLHAELTKHESREELLAELRNVANHFDGEVWLEQICLQTAPPIDRDKLKAGNDLLGNLLCDLDRLAGDNDRLAGAADCLTQLMQKDPAELERAGIKPNDPETLRRWLVQSRRAFVGAFSGWG